MLLFRNSDRSFDCQPEHMHRFPASVAFHSDGSWECGACPGFYPSGCVGVALKCWTLKTTVSWIMVLIRKQYFREHCETVMRDYRERHRIRGVWSSIAKRSFRRKMSGLKAEEEPVSPDGPIASPGGGIVAALAAGAGVGLGVGLGDKAIQDAASDGQLTTNPLEEESLPVRKHTMQSIAADVHSFTSSPRSIVSHPVLPSPGHGSPGVRWDDQSFQGRTDRNYMRKRTGRFSSKPVRICADDRASSSDRSDDTKPHSFGDPKAERPRHGRIPRTNRTLPTVCANGRSWSHRACVEQDRGVWAKA